MKTAYKVFGNTLIINLGSELDHHNASIIREKSDKHIYSGQIKNIIFDFTNTDFMDSSGIGVIMGRYKLVGGIGGKVSIVNVNSRINRIFQISGLHKVISKYDNCEEALKK